jgi:tRNA (guanine37-N1)-methyltransferase
MAFRVDVLTLFPEFYQSFLQDGVFARSVASGRLEFCAHNLRDHSDRPDRRVDDRPFGGGPGMVIRPDVTDSALRSLRRAGSKVVFVTPVGQVFDRTWARRLSQEEHLIFVAGRYEGFDERVVEQHAHWQLSLGDFVLSSGDPAVLAMVDAAARFVPGTLGNPESADHDSFEDGLLEEPVYTRPETFGGKAVPKVLMSGDHSRVEEFRRRQRLVRTAQCRPDLIMAIWENLTSPEQALVRRIWRTSAPRPSDL